MQRNGSINAKNPKLILPSTSNLIDIATIDMQGEKHKNFFTGLGNTDKVSNNNVENKIGSDMPNNNMINP